LLIVSAASYLQPVIDFVMRIKRKADLDSDALNIILKAVGVGVLTEIVGMICCDAGFTALDKAIKFVSSVVVLWLSIPLFDALLELLETILGNI
jgi:stage III sporulation protein AD